MLRSNKHIKICLNNYVPKHKRNLETYYVKLSRTPSKKGFRGSTRPHFFYETKKSMSTVHTQDGASKYASFKSNNRSKNNDKNYIFIINPNQDSVNLNPELLILDKGTTKKNINLYKLKIPSFGSKLLELDNINNKFEKYLFKFKANRPMRYYYII